MNDICKTTGFGRAVADFFGLCQEPKKGNDWECGEKNAVQRLVNEDDPEAMDENAAWACNQKLSALTR